MTVHEIQVRDRSTGVFTEWRFEEHQLFSTQDPEAFWVDIKANRLPYSMPGWFAKAKE